MGKADDVQTKDIEIPAEYRKPEIFPAAPVKDYGAFVDYVAKTEKVYDRLQREFLEMDRLDAKLPEMAEFCAKACRGMIMAGAALFGMRRGEPEDKEKALEILDKCKKDAGIREQVLTEHIELTEKEKSPDPWAVRRLLLKLIECQMFHYRTVSTQNHYLDLYIKDPNYMTPELAAEKRAGARVAEKMKMIPKGHMFLPARPFPPMRIPEGERVPYPPEAYQVWKMLPAKDLIYDAEHDEFMVPKGYVNEEKRIDDQSVVWNWEDRTVTMKFIGYEPVTWPFWKARDARDTMKPGSWEREYTIRMYKQLLQDLEPPGMRDG